MNRSLLSAVELERADGSFEPLLLRGYRGVSRAEGFAGMRTRENTLPRTGRHGSVNRSRHREDRTYTLTGLLEGGGDADRAWWEYDQLATVLAAATDTDRLLRWTRGGVALQALVRLVELIPPVEVGAPIIRYQLVLRAGDPRQYSQHEIVAAGMPLSAAAGGKTYPRLYPRTYNPGAGGIVAIDHQGTVPTPPLILLDGYQQDPTVILDSARRLVLSGEIAAGDTLYLDAGQYGRERSVLLNNEADRIGLLSFEESRWFDLPPGQSTLQLITPDFEPGAGIEVRYRNANE